MGRGNLYTCAKQGIVKQCLASFLFFGGYYGKEFVVIGLGRFGGSIVRELNALAWM